MSAATRSLKIFLMVSAIVAGPLAAFSAYFLEEELSVFVAFSAALLVALAAATVGWFLIYFTSKSRKFGVLEGLAASVVAWVAFCVLASLCGKVLASAPSIFDLPAWMSAALLLVYGLLFPPIWFVFMGGAFAGWLIARPARAR